MFSIGEFARHGRVSVRMLRHYDATGLLRPACVDPATGYRSYQVSQLAELNRLIALKELGFSLQQVTEALLEWASGQGLAWDMSPGEDGERWGGRVEFYRTNPAEEPDMNKWVTQLAFRLADGSD
jgi:DNA-binding transcriptional MerR regulator